MSRPVLYSYRRCPYAMRARMALWQAGVAVELREIQLRHKPRAMLLASPKGTVPVLVLPDGSVLEQSLDIMRWALQQHDPQGWLQSADWDSQQRWIELNDGPFKRLLDSYKYPERQSPPASPEQAFVAGLALMLDPMERQLEGQTFLLGERCSVADIALMPFVRQFAAVNPPAFEAAPLPRLRGWLAKLTSLPLFEQVMQKQPSWQEPSHEPQQTQTPCAAVAAATP